MLPLASEHLTAVRRLRPAARTGEQQRRLAVVEAQAGRLVGKLAVHNLGDQRSARTAYGIALAAAHDAGPDSVTLRAYVLGGMAFMESQVGDPKTAVATMTQALEVGRASTLAPLRCWLASTAATVHARVGDRRACDQALRASDDLFALPSPNDPAWTGSLDRAFLLGDKAACLLRLNQPQPALETLAQAERLVPQKRLQRRTVLLGHRPACRVSETGIGGCSSTSLTTWPMSSLSILTTPPPRSRRAAPDYSRSSGCSPVAATAPWTYPPPWVAVAVIRCCKHWCSSSAATTTSTCTTRPRSVTANC
jgi:hypothetical protein